MVRQNVCLGIFIPSCGTNHHPMTMIGMMNSSRLTVYPYGVALAGGICVGTGIRTVCRAIPAGTAIIASMATTIKELFSGSEELAEEGLDIAAPPWNSGNSASLFSKSQGLLARTRYNSFFPLL